MENQPKGSLSLDSSNGATETALGESDTVQYETRETSDILDATEPFFVASHPTADGNLYNSATDDLANKKKQFIEIWHVPTQLNVFFKSFITTFQDTYTTEYNKESVFGRMDPVATYKRTGRVITLGWDVPASGLEEAKENLAKMNRLVQFLYPVYDNAIGAGSGATTMRSGPIFKIKMGNLIMKPGHDTVNSPAAQAGLPGIIEGFSFTPKLEFGVFDPAIKQVVGAKVYPNHGEHKNWESTRKTREGTAKFDGSLYPKMVSAQIRFTVLHDTPLGWEMEGANGAVLRNNKGAGTKASRFPYGGNNAPVDPSTGKRVRPYVEEADWKSFLDLQKDLAVRRIQVRAGKILQPYKDIKQFIGG